MQNPRKSHIDSIEPMTRKFVKCLFPDSLLKAITVYFTPKICCMKNRVAKEPIGTFYLMEKYYKEIKLYSVPKVV
mgnify:CR=1 FL=1